MSLSHAEKILESEVELAKYMIQVDNPKLKCCCCNLKYFIMFVAYIHILWTILEISLFFIIDFGYIVKTYLNFNGIYYYT